MNRLNADRVAGQFFIGETLTSDRMPSYLIRRHSALTIKRRNGIVDLVIKPI